MSAEKSIFDRAQNAAVWRLANSHGMSAAILEYGGILQSLTAPDRQGRPVDVVLGFDTLEGYRNDTAFLGATVGRVSNRIAGASFSLNGTEYPLAANCGRHHLHGGPEGFHRRVWRGERAGENAVRLSRRSPDGEEGYPGTLDVSVTYALTEDNALRITYEAVSDRDTPVSLTNHSYFNLAGGGDAMGHVLELAAGYFLENDGDCVPTGTLLPVAGTPFDFRTAKPVGRDIGRDDEQLRRGGGYDHNYVLSGSTAAVLSCPETGIVLTVRTTMPGMQLYTANALPDAAGKGGAPMGCRTAVCLETQQFPDAVHRANFPSPILRAGEQLREETEWRFTVR